MANLRLLIISSIFFLAASLAGSGAPEMQMSFININPGTANSGMGQANAAVSEDGNSIYYNPAGLNGVDRMSVSLNHIEWLESIHIDYLSCAYTLKSREQKYQLIILVDDFNQGVGTNYFEGSSGVWCDNNEVNAVVSSLSARDESGSMNKVCKVYCNLKGSKMTGGWYTVLKGLDASRCDMIQITVNATKSPSFKIGIKDAKQTEVKVDAAKYLKKRTSWETIQIPLSDFRGVDFSSLEKISFTFENGDANLLQEMELLIDDIAFLKRDTFTYGTIALSVGTLYMNEMERLTEDSLGNLVRLNSTFGAQNYSFMLSYANNVNVAGIDLKLGLTGKFLLQQIGTVADRQFMSDFGMMYADKEGVYSLGVVFQNISGLGDVFSAKGGGPFNVNVGTGGRLFKKNLFLAFCMNFPKTGVPTVSAGIEYRLFGFLFPRVGYEFMNDMINFSAGLGTTYKTYQFDYALSVTRESVIIHRLAISYKI